MILSEDTKSADR